MCGIAGWANIGVAPEAARATLARMCDAIAHRGPDDSGIFVGDRVGLGIQRLSIVDLSGGHQPMSSEDGALQVVFNGEIYNHSALRRNLESAGAHFRTRSDTEVILRTYQRDGLAGFEKFNGMFAIAVWDGRVRRLHLSRDRMGVKPLYYARARDGIVFASEIKAILASGLVERDINPRAIWDYLTFRYVPAPETIWRNVFKLPPGHRLTLGEGDAAPRVERWWDVPIGSSPPEHKSESEYLGEFTALFEDAVDQRMIADVPVGILLSGGLDSSAVAAAAARNGSAVETFSVAFQGAPDIDEREHARAVARHLGARHSEVVIGRREFMDFLPQLVHWSDEPMADLASVPLFYVSHLARGAVKAALSGEGSDEIFGGYTFDRWVARWDAARNPHPGRDARSNWMRKVLGRVWPGFGRFGAGTAVETDLRRLPVPLAMTDYATSEEKRSWFRNAADFPDSQDGARAALARIGAQDPLNQALYVYCQDWLVEDLLMKADRMSMANSLELRTPFLDYRLVEWAWRLPPKLKVGVAGDGRYQTKRILRDYARSMLPLTIVERPKMGFPVPAYDWLSHDIAGWARDLLSRGARVRAWLTDHAVDLRLQVGTSPAAGVIERHRLWNLLVLETWLRRWQG